MKSKLNFRIFLYLKVRFKINILPKLLINFYELGRRPVYFKEISLWLLWMEVSPHPSNLEWRKNNERMKKYIYDKF